MHEVFFEVATFYCTLLLHTLEWMFFAKFKYIVKKNCLSFVMPVRVGKYTEWRMHTKLSTRLVWYC